MNIGQSIREQLEELAEEKYRMFTASLTPGAGNILGVRLPILRKMAVKIAKEEDWRLYLLTAGRDTFEEVMLQGMVIGCVKTDLEEKLQLIAGFTPRIDNWAVCDSFISGLKFTREHRERVWEFLQPYFNSGKEYELRFGVVMLLNYYVLPEYASRAFSVFDCIKHEGYYVRMAVAWAVSAYFTAMPEVTFEYLKKNELDDFTYNKSLQKITESLKVEKETKDRIRKMKRHTK